MGLESASTKSSRFASLFALLLAGLICFTTDLPEVAAYQEASSDKPEMERVFTLQLLPLLKDKCLGCHGSDANDLKGDFSVVSRVDLLHGGESGLPSIVPGEPEQSSLIEAIAWEGLEMPPKENDRLTEKQVELFRDWIRQGAPWPDEAMQRRYRLEAMTEQANEEGVLLATSGGLSDEWTYRRYQPAEVWAFQPLRAATELLPGEISDDQAIDFFINRALAEANLQASAAASPRELIRRASFDLIGLPPTAEETAAFEQAYRADADRAWRELVDRLLASPRYGERSARHWFDVTRYSDTGGMSNDFERSNMWRYRDYVIRAFNEDKSYQQFIIEQLAGDELADQSVLERNGNDWNAVDRAQREGDYTEQEAEWIIATGFLRMGPWDNAMIAADEARQIYLDDLVNITGQTFLGQTLRCCKCHDHKFDPIPTRDYYRFYSAFSATRMAEREVPFLATENREGFVEGRKHVEQMLEFAVREKNKLVEKREAAAREWFTARDLPYRDFEERKKLPDEEKPPRHVGLNYVEQGQLKVREQDEWIWTRRLERYQPMAQSVYNAATASLAWNAARKLRLTKEPIPKRYEADAAPTSHVLLGGALTAPGPEVRPGVLSAVSLHTHEPNTENEIVPTSVAGRRLALARWIASPDNPLTSRAIVNRVWQAHFGVGIAGNANNLGVKGGQPSHSELLDYLATTFVEDGWSLKQLHRRIMLSDAYRRSAHPVDLERVKQLDPDNKLLSHFRRRRLTAEEFRDAMLAVTGELVQAEGGLPVMPEINMEVALQPRMIQFSLAPAYQPSATPRQRNRRSIYAYQVRGQADPFSELFNQPNPNESCERRETAAVTPQAFALLNSDLISDRSIGFALSLEATTSSLDEQIELAFKRSLNRKPSEQELKRMRQYLEEMEVYHQQQTPAEADYPTSITRSLVEEFSGRPFEYQEVLPVFENYQADPKPADVSPRTRALADFCLLLLNTNEFMYVN